MTVKKKNKKTKVLKIENGVTYLESSNGSDVKPKRKFSDEARKKLSVARRARKKQPREGTSNKAQNLHDQLTLDYLHKDSKVKMTPKQRKEIEKFLKQKSSKLKTTKEETQALGILTEYHIQKFSFHEIRVEQMLFDNNDDSTDGSFEDASDTEMDKEFNDIIGNDFDSSD